MAQLNKTLLAFALTLAATSLCAVPASAADAKKPAKTKKAKAAVAEEGAVKPTTPEDEPDVADTKIFNFTCELNNTVTIYSNENDPDHVALRWKKRLHRLTRVGTTTGAQRFENRNFGLVWINIPSKAMLLDSRLNRQLANECKSPESGEFVPQAPVVQAPPAPIGEPALLPSQPDPETLKKTFKKKK
ncbi:MAG: hypothetical protein ACJ8GW_06580 [Massilia sp.]